MVLEKTKMRQIENPMLFDGPKPLNSIESVIHKNDENKCQSGPHKSCFGTQNGGL